MLLVLKTSETRLSVYLALLVYFLVDVEARWRDDFCTALYSRLFLG